ncbi:tetratricopeptide repeat protein [Streptobacillus moniliformis]|uniref:tetratricopeptide repeat protein n=1 Tax=Streptobacillus moniliformis TaxID=34105 RepID=UPI0007E3B93A|nr:tetratricopeptide repeat protein [Streptobacillus moniliformis]
MKKIFLALLVIPLFLKGDFLEELQKIDILLQKGQYKEALQKGKELTETEITEDDRSSLQNLLSVIEKKIKSESGNLADRIFNNTGEINFTTNEVAAREFSESASSGTFAFPGDVLNDAAKYQEYANFEKEVLANDNTENIYTLSTIYMKSGLYERAMNLGLRSNEIRTIYNSALAARLIGKYEIAIKQYSKVLYSDPSHLNSLLGLGLSYRGMGDKASAINYLQKYLNSGGTNPNIDKTIEYLSR